MTNRSEWEELTRQVVSLIRRLIAESAAEQQVSALRLTAFACQISCTCKFSPDRQRCACCFKTVVDLGSFRKADVLMDSSPGNPGGGIVRRLLGPARGSSGA